MLFSFFYFFMVSIKGDTMVMLFIDPFEGTPAGSLITNTLLNNYIKDFSFVLKDLNDLSIYAGLLSDRCLRIGQYDRNIAHMTWLGDVTGKVITVGFALSISNNQQNTPSGFTPDPVGSEVISFSDNDSCKMRIGSDYSLILGDLVTEANVLADSFYSYIEITVDMVDGHFTLYSDGGMIGTGTMSLSESKFIRFGHTRGITNGKIHNYFLDDIYILDNTGDSNNAPLGPVRIKRLPLLESTQNNFVSVGVENNIEAVNKTNLSIGTYTRSNLSTHNGDMFKVDTSTLPEASEIIAVQQKAMYRKTDYGNTNILLVSKENESEATHITKTRLLGFSSDTAHILNTTPEGSSWDKEKLSMVEFGYRVEVI